MIKAEQEHRLRDQYTEVAVDPSENPMVAGIPLYFEGWYQVAWASDIRKKQVKRMHYFGRELVAFRTESGEVNILDAYCPHLGAHLGHGGKVNGESVVCPFHGWEYNGEGRCSRVPYANRKVTDKPLIKSWPTLERNGIIFMYYGATEPPPERDVPEVPEFNDEEWSGYTKRRHVVDVNILEMTENSVDRAHFLFVHKTKNIPESSLDWRDDCLIATQTTRTNLLGKEFSATVNSQIFLPGFSIIRFNFVTEITLVLCNTPIEPNRSISHLSFMSNKKKNWLTRKSVAALVIREINHQFNQDRPIWENKIYLEKPVLCDADGPIMQLRRWHEQFAPKHAR